MVAVADPVLHITTLADWSEAAARGGSYGDDRFADGGFLHLSTPEQVAGPANALFAGHPDVWLLVVDPARLPVPLRWEPGDPPTGDGSLFPHLYVPLPTASVVAAVPYVPIAGHVYGRPVGLPDPADHLGRAYALEWYLARARATLVGELDPAFSVRQHEYAVSSQHNRLVLRRDHGPREAEVLCALERCGLEHWQVYINGPVSTGTISDYEALGWTHNESLIMIAAGAPTRPADPDIEVVEVDAATGADEDGRWTSDVARLVDPELRELVEREAVTGPVARRIHVAVLDEDGDPEAWADLYAAGATAQLENVMVRPDRRRHGLGTAVAVHAVTRAHGFGCDVVFLRTDAADWSHDLYEQIGFQAAGVAHVFDRCRPHTQ